MPDDTTPGEKSNDHLLLAKLLERQRDEKEKQAVDRVLEMQLSVPEKVRRIEEIDGEGGGGYISAGRRRRTGPSSGDAGRPADHTSLTELEEAEQLLPASEVDPQWQRELRRRRVEVKNRIEKVGLIGFLFYDWPKVRRFNRDYRHLRMGILPWRLSLHPDRVKQIGSELIPAAGHLGAILTQVLADGWRHLGKEEYNLLVLLSGLCNALSEVVPERLDARGRDVLRKLRAVERSFYVYRRQDPDGNRGDRALSRYRENSGDAALDWEGARRRHFLLTASHQSGGLLEGVLLALNMAEHRRFLTVSDLIDHGVGKLISSDRFECSKEVRERIREYLKDLILQLPPYVDGIRDIRRINLFLAEGAPEAVVSAFYENQVDGKKSFAQARENSLELLVSVSRRLLEIAQPLLDGTLPLRGYGEGSVFEPSLFYDELSRAKLLLSRLEKLSYSFPSFPEQRFLELRRGGNGATALESEAIAESTDLLFIFVQLGKRIIDLLGKRKESPLEGAGENLPLGPEAIKREAIHVPELSAELQGEGFWSNGTLLDGMQRLTQLLLGIPRYFEEPSLITSLRRESRLKRELQRRLSIIQTIAPPETVARVQELYTP